MKNNRNTTSSPRGSRRPAGTMRRVTDVRPKKNLGQHFLCDENVAERIAATVQENLPASIPDAATMPIAEVGPGMGVLTKYLIATGRPLKCIELDSESVAFLARHYPDLEVTEGDFLRMDLSELFGRPFALIGNYPYNISSQIFFKVLDYREYVPVVSGMLQKEVAERICSRPGSKVYGILSVLLQMWYDCEYLFNVGPEVFHPQPKVMSAVLRLTRNSRREAGCDERLFKRVVKTAFGQRRKRLRNSLASLIPAGSPALESPMMMERPEQLSVEDFIALTNLIDPNRE